MTAAEGVVLRHEPIQARSSRRLSELEAAAREALGIYGRDRLTTAQVAEIAGCSIGTVYRYFPDRVAILDRIWPDRDAHLPEGFVPGLDETKEAVA